MIQVPMFDAKNPAGQMVYLSLTNRYECVAFFELQGRNLGDNKKDTLPLTLASHIPV